MILIEKMINIIISCRSSLKKREREKVVAVLMLLALHAFYYSE